jgi:ribosomal protein L18E
MPIQRRIPKRGFTNVNRVEYQAVNVGSLASFSAGEKVTRETLRAKRLINRGDHPVKLLGEGEVKAAFQISVDAASATAREKIEAAGGTITLPEPKVRRARGEQKVRIPRPHEAGGPKSARGRKPGGGGPRIAGVPKPGGGGPKRAGGRKPGPADRG